MSQVAATASPAPIRHRAFSLARVWAIASNTLLELVRLKVFYFLLLFALLVIGSSLFSVQIAFQDQFQVLKDTCLGSMSLFSWLLSVLATAMLLPKDLEDRTLYTILAKPVPRFEYLLGKLLGVLALLAVAVLLMTVFFLGILYLHQQNVLGNLTQGFPAQPTGEQVERLASLKAEVYRSTFTPNLVAGIVAIFVKAALCASLTLFLSTFSTSWIFTILMSMMVFLIGHLQHIARDQWMNEQTPTVAKKIFLMVVALIFPDLQIFSLVDDIAAGTAVPMMLFWKMSGLGTVYTCFYLLAGYFMFAKREL